MLFWQSSFLLHVEHEIAARYEFDDEKQTGGRLKARMEADKERMIGGRLEDCLLGRHPVNVLLGTVYGP